VQLGQLGYKRVKRRLACNTANMCQLEKSKERMKGGARSLVSLSETLMLITTCKFNAMLAQNYATKKML